MNKLFVLICFLIFSGHVLAQPGKTAEIKRINAYCKMLDRYTDRFKNPQLIFADTSDYEQNTKPKWRKFASEKSLEKFRDKTETYSIAYNWQKNRKLVKSNFTLFSPSGDWSNYIYHYFRPDGSLAKAELEVRTFEGDLIIIQDLYFDRKGKLIRKTTKYRDLNTEKPIKPTKEVIENSRRMTGDIDYYKKTSKLPFARLLRNI